MPARTFKELFCERFACASEDYEDEALQRCFYPHAVPWLKILKMFGARSVKEAHAVIVEAGKTTTTDQFQDVIREYRNRLAGALFGFDVKARLSSTQLLKLVCLFEDAAKK